VWWGEKRLLWHVQHRATWAQRLKAMATNVWIVLCKQAPTLSGTTLAQECPVAQRISVQTTVEALQIQPASTNPLGNLNRADAASVFMAAFSIVVLNFLIGRGVGTVLKLIRNG
jgi:hypothetical protein